MLFVLTSNHIENVFLCFLMYGHGKLDLKFVHGSGKIGSASNKIRPKGVTHQRPKLPRKIVEPRVLEKRVYLVTNTFTLISNCYRK